MVMLKAAAGAGGGLAKRGAGASKGTVTVMMRLKFCLLGWGLLMCGSRCMWAEDAQAMVRRAVQSEIRAAGADHSRWRYRDEEQTKKTVSIVVETDAGSVKRLVERDGRPLSKQDATAEGDRIEDFIHDPSKLAKQRKDGAADDQSAGELLQMLPVAFVWKVANESADDVTFSFVPNPSFRPPDMQSKVMSAMGGELVVEKRQQRIKTIKGTLTQDVMLGFGILGRMKGGGTFDVERREVKPGIWQITETHVHIDGRALFFKTIGQQQDELETEFEQVPGTMTLEQAAAMSKVGR